MSDATLPERVPGISILALVAVGAALVAASVPWLTPVVIAVTFGAMYFLAGLVFGI